jgi:hypothetical protein
MQLITQALITGLTKAFCERGERGLSIALKRELNPQIKKLQASAKGRATAGKGKGKGKGRGKKAAGANAT